MQGNSRITNINKIGLLIVIILVVVGGIAFFIKSGLTKHQPTTALISLSYPGLPNTQGLSLKFNNQTYEPNSSNTYVVAPGSYTINISKAGYQTFTTKLVANVGQTYDVNVQLKQVAAPSTIGSIQQLNAAGLGLPQQATILSTNYFYGNTWAVVVASAYGSNATLVTQYNFSSQTWDVILGPGSSFTQAEVQKLPSQVSGYLTTNNYVNG